MFNIFLRILALAINVTGLYCAIRMVRNEVEEKRKDKDETD